MSKTVFEPVDAAMAASMLADADRQRLTVVPRGSGTKLSWIKDPENAAAFLSTKRLNEPVQHFAGDLVATIPSGATLSAANAILAKAGQWLPLDPSHADRATIGGIVATNDSGPRRHKYGSPRDLIIGIEIALCDGRVAKAGGRVVKNVAGYDLSRLVCGSFGSLAVITSATFKLAPLPVASRTILARCPDLQRAARLALEVAAQPMTPSALEIRAPSAELLVRFESTERAADQMVAATETLLSASETSADILSGVAEQDAWKMHESQIWEKPGVIAKLSVLPTDVEHILGFIHRLDRELEWAAIGRAALGVLFVRINASGLDASFALERLRQHVHERNGTFVILRGDSDIKSPRAEAGDSLAAVMDAVKMRFDPNRVLPPVPA